MPDLFGTGSTKTVLICLAFTRDHPCSNSFKICPGCGTGLDLCLMKNIPDRIRVNCWNRTHFVLDRPTVGLSNFAVQFFSCVDMQKRHQSGNVCLNADRIRIFLRPIPSYRNGSVWSQGLQAHVLRLSPKIVF